MGFLAFLIYIMSLFLLVAFAAQQEVQTNAVLPQEDSSLLTSQKTSFEESGPAVDNGEGSGLQHETAKEGCYPELGCFPTSSPWFGVFRPFPGTEEPVKIATKLFLYTRKQPEVYEVTTWPKVSLDGSDFDPNRTTVVITHGFASNTSNGWMVEMKDAYLKSVDANVFLVDWGRGSKGVNYFQAASNTRVVGAELGRFGRHIVDLGQDPGRIHAIGHSLGAHISGYFGKRMLRENRTLGRITALDPAQPGFETEGPEVKVTKGDATIVDVLHTDARPFIPYFGFGMLQPTGDIDFYLNGGALQPGCYTVEIPPNITSILDIAHIPIETLSKWISCSHGRSYEYFTWSIKNRDCLFVGRKMSNTEAAFRISTLGTLRLADPVINSVRTCSKSNCNILGLLSPFIPARGNFAISTKSQPPFCMTREEEARSLFSALREEAQGFIQSITSLGPTLVRRLRPPLF